MRNIVYNYCNTILLLVSLCLLVSQCANRGIGPQGGPVDSIPPTVISESPKNGTLLFNKKNVEIVFNEYIKLNNVQTNVFISPPPKKQPEIQTLGKKIRILFEDSLQKNTTYFINFGDAIGDNNENNLLKNYSLSFSTGNSLDSLAIFGQLVNASDLNPVSDIIIGIHNDLSDSAIFTKPFIRIGKTDEYGMFAIKNIAHGKYKIFALNDMSNDFIYQPGEHIAFLDSIIVPSLKIIEKNDTIFKDTLIQDSLQKIIQDIKKNKEVFAEPADILLFLFQDEFIPSYFRRAIRSSKHKFELLFASLQDTLPQLRALNPQQIDTNIHTNNKWIDWTKYIIAQRNNKSDTITYWITDSIAMQDSLYAEITYHCTDSNHQLVKKTDTLNLIFRPRKLNNRAQTKLKQKEQQRKVNIKSNGKDNFEIYDTLSLFFDYPLQHLYKDSIHLFSKKDSTKIDIPFSYIIKDSAHTHYQIIAPLKNDEIYYLRIDSGGAVDIYGHVNNLYKTDLKVRSITQYATLNIILKHFSTNMRLQLLDNKENVIQDVPCTQPNVKFIHLHPKEYYLRLYYDLNNDGKYTTGDIKTKRQPEPVFYFPAKLSLRANWDFEEIFDHLATPQLQSKPIGIVKDAKTNLNKK